MPHFSKKKKINNLICEVSISHQGINDYYESQVWSVSFFPFLMYYVWLKHFVQEGTEWCSVFKKEEVKLQVSQNLLQMLLDSVFASQEEPHYNKFFLYISFILYFPLCADKLWF